MKFKPSDVIVKLGLEFKAEDGKVYTLDKRFPAPLFIFSLDPEEILSIKMNSVWGEFKKSIQEAHQ